MKHSVFRRFTLLLVLMLTPHLHAINDTSFLEEPEHLFWFDIADLPTLKLTFSEDQWSALLTSTQDVRPEVSANLTYYKNASEFHLDNIAVKVSGNTSFKLPQNSDGNFVQANFTLDFDEFVDDQELSGIGKLKLKRFKDDSTFVHEPLSNQIMHNFGVWTVHSSTYARLEITVGNRANAYFGMYRMNESVNRKTYLDKRFGPDNSEGFLWQGNHKAWGEAHFSRITDSWGGVGDFDQASFEYKGKGSRFEEGKTQLIDLAQNFTSLQGQAFEDYIALHINMPLLLKGLASEAVIGHWDGFWGNGNNYFIYIDESEVVHFVPYDTDNTLGTSLFVEDVGERNPFEFGLVEKTPLLVSKIFEIPAYREQYAGYIEILVTQQDLMVEEYATAWIDQVHTLIQDDLVNETGDNQAIVDQPANWGNQGSYRLFDLNSGKNWYSTRKNAVLEAIANEGKIYPTVYYRGVTNQWGTSLMSETSLNIWTITVDNNEVNNSSGEPRFKFDINADWSQNFGDNDGDGFVDADGADIPFAEGFGEYTITFNALDGSYLLEKTTVVLLPPIADAGADFQIEQGVQSNFDGSDSSDPDGEIVSYQWSNELTGINPLIVYQDPGSYEVTLTVTDNDGLTSSDSVTVTVTEKPESGTTPSSGGGGALPWSYLMFIGLISIRRINSIRL